MDPLEELTQKVVRHLSNHSNIELKWQPPKDTNALGQCHRFRDDSALITIHPNISLDTKFSIMLHECAHIRHDFSWMPIEGGVIKPESNTRTDEARQGWRKHPRETRAQAQADEWESWAENKAWKFKKYNNTWMEAKLLSLLAWKGGTMKSI